MRETIAPDIIQTLLAQHSRFPASPGAASGLRDAAEERLQAAFVTVMPSGFARQHGRERRRP